MVFQRTVAVRLGFVHEYNQHDSLKARLIEGLVIGQVKLVHQANQSENIRH